MKNDKGITLVETLLVSTLTLFVLSTAFYLFIHFGDSQKTELARMRMTEESRFMFNSFADQLKDAGSILTLSHTNSFLASTPYFNGIFPLDKNNGPDGVILASGDPNGVTTLAADYTPPSSTITVKSTYRSDGSTPAWAVGDTGIIISTTGYYVFKVTALTATELTVRNTAVYYSGLLNSCGTYAYSDTLQSPATSAGNAITYAAIPSIGKTPVMRLTDFSIYLFDRVYDAQKKRNINRMYRITDSGGVGTSALLSSSASIVSDSIFDMQISYAFYTDFPNPTPVYTLKEASSDPTLPAPYASETIFSLIQKKMLKEINATIVVLTDEYGGSKHGLPALSVPATKNRPAYSLPTGKYRYRMYSYNIQNKNFNIVL